MLIWNVVGLSIWREFNLKLKESLLKYYTFYKVLPVTDRHFFILSSFRGRLWSLRKPSTLSAQYVSFSNLSISMYASRQVSSCCLSSIRLRNKSCLISIQYLTGTMPSSRYIAAIGVALETSRIFLKQVSCDVCKVGLWVLNLTKLHSYKSTNSFVKQ